MAKRVFFASEPGWYAVNLASNGCSESRDMVVWISQKMGLASPVELPSSVENGVGRHYMVAGLTLLPDGEEGRYEMTGPFRSGFNMLTYRVVTKKT